VVATEKSVSLVYGVMKSVVTPTSICFYVTRKQLLIKWRWISEPTPFERWFYFDEWILDLVSCLPVMHNCICKQLIIVHF